MRNKKIAAALLLILPLFITACSLQELPLIGKFFGEKDASGGGADTPVTLNFWGLWEEPTVMESMLAKYKEANPNVTVNYDDRTVVGVDAYREALFNRAGQEDAPDIVLIHNSWVSRLRGSLEPSNDIEISNFEGKYYKPAATSAVFDGKVYAIPMFYDGIALVYNKNHFKEIDQLEPPTAWEEFRKLALDLTVNGPENTIVRGGAAIGAANNIDFAPDILGLLFSQANVEIPGNLNTDSAADALTFYTNFLTVDRVWDTSFPEAATAFAQEKVSMIFAPSWVVLDILRARPDLDIGVAPVPQALPDNPSTWSSFWMVGVPTGSSNKNASWEFLKFLMEDESQLMYFSEASKYRDFGPPYSSVSLADQVSAGSILESYLEMAPYGKTGPIAARAGNVEQDEAIREAMSSVISRSSPSGEALIKAATTIAKAQ